MAVRSLQPADVKFLAVHCSATKADQNFTARDIDRWHRERGFLKIGYHWVIRRDGTVEQGRPMNEVGAHVEGHNHESIGICMVGGVNAKGKAENNFTDIQFSRLEGLLELLKKSYPNATIQGHRDFPNVAKDCPSFDVKSWVATTSLA